jgi:hypothetical protein
VEGAHCWDETDCAVGGEEGAAVGAKEWDIAEDFVAWSACRVRREETDAWKGVAIELWWSYPWVDVDESEAGWHCAGWSQ